jgi:hypothetical protein
MLNIDAAACSRAASSTACWPQNSPQQLAA